MKRGPAKKSIERRKHTRSPRSSVKAKDTVKHSAKASVKDSARAPQASPVSDENCWHCTKSLRGDDQRALYVEEEVGRVFCSEACIAAFFTPEIDRLEKDFFKRLSSSDLTGEERESLAHLRWITLQEPDEVWREKTLAGDYRYTLISEFKPGAKKVWCVCICLFLKGEPSFLYMAFPTRNSAMVNHYRKGEQIEWEPSAPPWLRPQAAAPAPEPEGKSDRLGTAWTEDETFLAQFNRERSADDIPVEEFSTYDSCVEESLETPDEVWSIQTGSLKLYHFIRYYEAGSGKSDENFWYVIVARETTDDDQQIEIVDLFPTRDQSLVDHYRQGEQEVGDARPGAQTARLVH
jgi:hypothetical protein